MGGAGNVAWRGLRRENGALLAIKNPYLRNSFDSSKMLIYERAS